MVDLTDARKNAQQRELERAKAWAQEMLAKRSGLKRVPLVIALSDLDGLSVQELVEWADNIRDQVPPEHWSTSKINVDYGGGEYSGDLSGYYDRPQTEEERAKDMHYQTLKEIATTGRTSGPNESH